MMMSAMGNAAALGIGLAALPAAATSSAPAAPRLGGAERDRTADPLLAKQVLSQLSYTPVYLGQDPEN